MCEIRFCKKCGAQMMITTAGEYCPNCHYNTALYSTTYVSDRSDGECRPSVAEKETVALKPCPFCGCEVDCRQLVYGAIGGGWTVERNHHADNCIMKDLRFSGMLSKDSLISRWNRRAKMKEDEGDIPGAVNLPYHYDTRDKTEYAISDAVDHPKHYGGEGSVYETINVIEAWGLDFNLGNAVKYISRAGKKDPAKEAEDLKKAVWYLERRIHQLEGKE